MIDVRRKEGYEAKIRPLTRKTLINHLVGYGEACFAKDNNTGAIGNALIAKVERLVQAAFEKGQEYGHTGN